jgi:hypothetical protein
MWCNYIFFLCWLLGDVNNESISKHILLRFLQDPDPNFDPLPAIRAKVLRGSVQFLQTNAGIEP